MAMCMNLLKQCMEGSSRGSEEFRIGFILFEKSVYDLKNYST